MKSLRSSFGSLNSDNSSSTTTATTTGKQQQGYTASLVELEKAASSTDLDQTGSSLSLTPSSLNLQGLRFDAERNNNGDIEVQSPDWDSYFTDHFDTNDFMISSPVLSSPQLVSSYNSYAQGLHGPQSMLGCSPPRFGPFGTNHQPKPKGMSPLHKVFNSPSNQFMHIESLTLPAIEEFLNDDYSRHDLGAYSLRNSDNFGHSNSSNSMMDHHLSMNNVHQPTRFGRGLLGGLPSQGSGSSQMGYDQSDMYRMSGSDSGSAGVPLSEQLKQEDEQEQQLHQNLMGTVPMAPDQVISLYHFVDFSVSFVLALNFCSVFFVVRIMTVDFNWCIFYWPAPKPSRKKII